MTQADQMKEAFAVLGQIAAFDSSRLPAEQVERLFAIVQDGVAKAARERQWAVAALFALAGEWLSRGKAPNLERIDRDLTRLLAEWEKSALATARG